MTALIAVVLANLPRRVWCRFDDRFPVQRMAPLSGLLVMLCGIALGITGYLAFVQEAADGMNRVLIGSQSDLVQVPGWALLSLPAFLVSSPIGALATYLTLSGFLRGAGAYLADDRRGDYLLTAADTLIRRVHANVSASRRRADRVRLEGRDVPDRVVTGRQVRRPEFPLILLAARAKQDWTAGAYLVGQDGAAYRIGAPFDFTSPSGLRTAYPLTPLTTLEPIRHAIPYDLPTKMGTDPVSETGSVPI